MARNGGRFCTFTRELEIYCNINKLPTKDRALLYHYFFLNLPILTVMWLHKQSYKKVMARLFKILRGLVK